MSEAKELTKDRHWEREKRSWDAQGLGATDGSQMLIGRYFDEYRLLVDKRLTTLRSSKGFKGAPRVILNMDAERLTYLLMYYGLCSVGDDNPTMQLTMRTIGFGVELQAFGDELKHHNAIEAERLEKVVKSTHSSVTYRKRAIHAYANRLKDFVFSEWSDKDRLQAGKIGLETLLEGNLFTVDSDNLFTITEEARLQLDGLMEALVMNTLIGLPQTGPVKEWTDFQLYLEDNTPYSLVRTYQKKVRRHVEEAIKFNTMAPALEALNHAQAVQWAVNRPLLDLIKSCYDLGIDVSGLPPKADLPSPPKDKPWEDMTDSEKKLWKAKASDIKTANRGLLGERVILTRDIKQAERLLGKPFWTPLNFDYRGRVYGLPHFAYARQDFVRSMFQFEEGQVLNEEGIYWLKVHLANCGDFEKVSKKSFEERIKWVNANRRFIYETGAYPLDNLMWTQADKPFLFVAACMALNDAIEGQPVHIPVAFDGSCSGLQHLCMMSRADSKESSLVNLLPNNVPSDIYQSVADIVKSKVEHDLKRNDLSEEHRVLANAWQRFGITRSTVKRNVMTYSYSSKRFGMQNQLMEDLMRPLELDVLSGKYTEHPFGEDNGYAAARYLSHHIYASIEEAISKPAEVMKFLQTIARTMAHEELPVTWTTPTGFPVMLRYPKMDVKRIDLFLLDKSLKRKRVGASSAIETTGIDKSRSANAISASFVHSMDATHLQMVVLAAKKTGIKSIALVHDSFGCLPNDAPRFRELIKRTFIELYENNDVLQDVLDTSWKQLTHNRYKLSSVPQKGNLQLADIMSAEYAFA
jgi:DNA-directed RNA polymerase